VTKENQIYNIETGSSEAPDVMLTIFSQTLLEFDESGLPDVALDVFTRNCKGTGDIRCNAGKQLS
jgi:hypothetical protein